MIVPLWGLRGNALRVCVCRGETKASRVHNQRGEAGGLKEKGEGEVGDDDSACWLSH